MKRTICLILVLSCLLLLAACSNKKSAKDPVNFYYCTPETEFGTQDSLIISQIRDAHGHSRDYHYLISQYLNGPTTYDCISPFPGGTTLEELDVDNSKARIVLSPHITTLSGSELMLACACITKTVLEMTGVHTVQISTSKGRLNGQDSITLTAGSFTYQQSE